MKKILVKLVLMSTLILGSFSMFATNVKADSTAKNFDYDFAITNSTQLVNYSGNPLGVALSKGSTWKVAGIVPGYNDDNYNYFQNNEIIQISSNGYVNARNGYLYRPLSAVLTTIDINGKPVYLINHKGQTISNRGLAANTKWYSDREMKYGKVTYYRVATDEFVSVSDVK